MSTPKNIFQFTIVDAIGTKKLLHIYQVKIRNKAFGNPIVKGAGVHPKVPFDFNFEDASEKIKLISLHVLFIIKALLYFHRNPGTLVYIVH
jgi:hypothetical protein